MFSKLFTFGLAALTLVGAAPATGLQGPMAISCSVNFESVGTKALTASVEPGTYRIVNVAADADLRSYAPNGPVLASRTLEYPGARGDWKVEPAEGGAFKITNVQFKVPVYVGNDRTLISGEGRPAAFAIQPAGPEVFVVKSVYEDLVWTVEDVDAPHSQVKLLPSGRGRAQLWRLERPSD